MTNEPPLPRPLAKLTESPLWPPNWNPFEVFLLCLSLVSAIGLLQGHSGSSLLDRRLSTIAVILWGVALGIGSGLALIGVYCYRRTESLMPGLHLERAGLTLVGASITVYSLVVIHSAADIAGVRYTVAIQFAYAGACALRAWQDHRAITRANSLMGRQPWRDMLRLIFRRSTRRPPGGVG